MAVYVLAFGQLHPDMMRHVRGKGCEWMLWDGPFGPPLVPDEENPRVRYRPISPCGTVHSNDVTPRSSEEVPSLAAWMNRMASVPSPSVIAPQNTPLRMRQASRRRHQKTREDRQHLCTTNTQGAREAAPNGTDATPQDDGPQDIGVDARSIYIASTADPLAAPVRQERAQDHNQHDRVSKRVCITSAMFAVIIIGTLASFAYAHGRASHDKVTGFPCSTAQDTSVKPVSLGLLQPGERKWLGRGWKYTPCPIGRETMGDYRHCLGLQRSHVAQESGAGW